MRDSEASEPAGLGDGGGLRRRPARRQHLRMAAPLPADSAAEDGSYVALRHRLFRRCFCRGPCPGRYNAALLTVTFLRRGIDLGVRW